MRAISTIFFYTALLAVVLYGYEAINGSHGHIVNTLVAIVFLFLGWELMPNTLTKRFIRRIWARLGQSDTLTRLN